MASTQTMNMPDGTVWGYLGTGPNWPKGNAPTQCWQRASVRSFPDEQTSYGRCNVPVTWDAHADPVIAIPRRIGFSKDGTPNPADVTSFMPGQDEWTWANMPDILYQDRPTKADMIPKEDFPMPPKILDSNGDPIVRTLTWNRESKGETSIQREEVTLRAWEILPDRIGSNECVWVFEAWLRIDPRIRLQDIIIRMSPLNEHWEEANKLSQSIRRFREALAQGSWRGVKQDDISKLKLCVVQASQY